MLGDKCVTLRFYVSIRSLYVSIRSLYVSIRSPYVTVILRDRNFYVDVTHATWEIRDAKILRVYKTTLRVCKTSILDCNFYVDQTQASWEMSDSKIWHVYKITVRVC